MKIAFFHELHSGGARRSVNEYAKGLKKNHTVDLYVVDEQLNEAERHYFSKIKIYKFMPVIYTGKNWKAKLYKDTIELYKIYELHKKIASEIDKNKYDLIFIEPSKYTQTPFILRFLKTKKIYYCQESLRMVYEEVLGIKNNIHPLKYLYERLNRYIRKHVDKNNIKQADLIITNSKYTQSNIRKVYQLNSIVCYLGVDTDIFKPNYKKKDIDILFIGNYDFCSGFSLLEEAKKYINTNLVIKISVSKKQWTMSDQEMRDLYCRSKIVICLTFNEPFGLIPIEAMSCGVPVIAVNEGGYNETIVNGKTGYLVKRNPKILAEKLNYLLSNDNLRNKMSDNAVRYINNQWTWEKSVQNLEFILKNIQ